MQMFQSAPRAEARGDVQSCPINHHKIMFQSAPRAEARGDQRSRAPAPAMSGFNPRPAPKRGAMRIPCASILPVTVSIRAPRRSAGRSKDEELIPSLNWFQSAPRAEARGDLIRYLAGIHSVGFNPRPAPKRGAICERLAVTFECS